MDAAAKTVELLTQRTLPDRPFYLSNSPDWRYRPPSDGSRRFEEWHCNRLQYSTLLSEADRGLLLTRPDYDMREEPSKPVPREISTLAKAGGEKKKLSLSDYKNKKTVSASASPPEPAIAKIKEAERAGASNPASPAASMSRHSSDGRPHADTRRSTDSRPSDVRRPRDSDAATDGKQRSSRDSLPAVDMSLPPKPPVSKYGLPPRPPSPASKKRLSEYDDDSRPQKRPKPENGKLSDDRPTNRDDLHRRKEHSSLRDSPLLNGKSSLKGTPIARSPASRPQGDSSVNGARSHATGSNKVTPTKESNKTVVPPLLSPLHSIFDDHTSPPKNEKKKMDDRSPKPRKPEVSPERKRPKNTMKLPPLLSPTLPPVVEEALRRKKQGSSESEDEQRRDERESPVKKKKRTYSFTESEEELPLARPKKPARKELVVTLKIPKSQRKMFKRILALPPSRDSNRHDYERATDDERSMSRKRPASHADVVADSVAMKKSRSSDVPSRSTAPTTPPRKSSATAMSRGNSNNSVAQTPGDTINMTPSTAGQESSKPDAKTLREKEVRLIELGRRLKHHADLAINGHRSPGSSNANTQRPRSSSNNSEQPNPKLGYILSLESTIAFMQGFQAQNQQRSLHSKKLDPGGWASLFPFLDYLQKELQRHLPSRRYSPPYALLLLLQATAVDELMRCYLSLDDASAGQLISSADLVKYERKRSQSLLRIRDTAANIENTRLRVDVSAWATLDEVTETALIIMRRWCREETVDWTTEIGPRDYGK